jgi:hypothetical protein
MHINIPLGYLEKKPLPYNASPLIIKLGPEKY